ncbi:hypothetical protein BDZ89DRAFT_1069198 [Hymenopellis radicata]|nr:hypothetical protein BDZ89DRAFT_1069198 [Hymenopellis radicata]
MADIPPEIFDTILDHVHILDGEANLSIMAPVHTFDTVPLTNHNRTIGVTFGALVAHPLCTFRSHVRRLSLHEVAPPTAFWVSSVLPQLALLPHVEDISIYYARFTNVAEEEWRAVSLWGPQLKRLGMHSIHFDQASRVTELVSRCTNLEHLALHYIEDGDLHRAPKGGDIFVGTPPLRFLRSLSLYHGIALRAEFLTWLCPRPGSIMVHTVELGYISKQNAHYLSRFLYDIGRSITSLAIAFSDSSDSTDGQDAFCRVADLTTLTKLETLQFGDLPIFPTYLGRGLSAKHVPSILAKLNSPCLKEIRFDVSMEEVADLEMIDWENIVPTLNGAGYSALEVLSFARTINEEILEAAKTWLHEHVGKRLKRNVEIRFYALY